MPLDAIGGTYADLMERHGFIPADHAKPQFFPVAARKLYDETGNELPGYLRIMREDDGRTLHVASDAYRIVTNEEAFGGFETALKSSTLDLTDMRIGTDYSHQGARCFRQYLLPAHQVQVKSGVTVALRLLMMNSYDGSLAFRGMTGAYNFVCANTSVSGNEFASFRQKHTGSLDVAAAIKGLATAAEQHVEEMHRWGAWPRIQVSDADARAVFAQMPQQTKTLVDHLVHAWLVARDNDERQGGGNLWCLYNVLTAWSTHGEAKVDGGRGTVRFERETRVRKLLEAPAFKTLAAA